jgi:hypothetical protein
MQINKFDGGLSQRVHASLVLPNEATVLNNVDNTDLLLNSALDYSVIPDEIISGYFYNFSDEWLSSTAARSYVEYKNYLYFTEENKRARKFDGNQETLLGIEAPIEKLVCTQAEPSASEKISTSEATLQYVYTYYNSQDDVESVPSPISDETVIAADKVADISGFILSDDYQVDKIRIYRIGDSITTMTLIEEIDHTNAVYRDDTLTLDLEGSLLDTYDNQVLETGARFLVEAYGIMFAAVGTKLYFSKIGEPDYWPATNFIEFAKNLTMILPVQDGILVAMDDRITKVVGTDSSTFRKLPLTTEQGSISHNSAKVVKTMPVWASKDGLCVYNGNYIQVISKDKLGKRSFDIVNAAVKSEIYYLCLTDGTILIMDLRFGMSYRTFSFSDSIDNIVVHNDTVYGRVGDNLVSLFTGDQLSFTYMSPLFIEGSHTQVKLYNNIYIRANGTFTVKIYIDGDEVQSKVITGNKTHDISPPAEQQRGYGMQIEIVGIGTVYEYEFKVVGRENGR